MARRIAMGTWAYSIGPYQENPVPFEDVVHRVHELGFDGLEIGGFGIHPNPDRQKTLQQRTEVRQLWESRGMDVCGLGPDLWSEQLITATTTDSYLAAYRKSLQFCQDLDIPVICVDTTEDPRVLGAVAGEPALTDRPTVDYDLALQRVCQTWWTCAQEAADAGVRLVWEFEPGFAFNRPSDIFRVLDGVDHDNFSVMFDTCHANMVAVHGARHPIQRDVLNGSIRELANRLRGRIGRIHLIDSDGTLHNNETSTHPPFGTGNLDFDQFMPAVVSAGCADDW